MRASRFLPLLLACTGLFAGATDLPSSFSITSYHQSDGTATLTEDDAAGKVTVVLFWYST